MVELIGHGRTADVFRYDENKVIKVFHQEFTPLAIEEYRKAQNIASVGVSAPYVYDFVDVDNKKGIVYEYVQGVSMLQLVQKHPFKTVHYAKLLACLHAKMHNRPVTGLANIKESIAETIGNIQQISNEKRQVIINYLLKLPDGDSLCHYDFHPDNVLISEGNAKVIDWMTAGAGNPCADVCRTGIILKSNILPPGTSTMESILIGRFRQIFYRSYITQYLKVTSVTMEEVERWLLPVSTARLAEGIESEVPYLNKIIKREMSKHKLI